VCPSSSPPACPHQEGKEGGGGKRRERGRKSLVLHSVPHHKNVAMCFPMKELKLALYLVSLKVKPRFADICFFTKC
jgi:hypothetical protein